ncbi:hypothetical protein D3C76_1678520 [compost metagenome]
MQSDLRLIHGSVIGNYQGVRGRFVIPAYIIEADLVQGGHGQQMILIICIYINALSRSFENIQCTAGIGHHFIEVGIADNHL